MKANEATGGGGGGGANGANSEPSSAAKKNSKRPKYSKFTQQELPACKPILTPGWVVATFIIIGCVFIPISLVSLFASERVVEIVDWYDETCIPGKYSRDHVAYIQSGETNKTCTRIVTVPKDMKGPVFVYYQIENFYQNHRRCISQHYGVSLHSAVKLHLFCARVCIWFRFSQLPPDFLCRYTLFSLY
ncbi:ALA-interacting subunit 1-like isoform X2 [Tripterygium wilfordii]|uniref:ALA-interacting subunit 1-like isoform X2 n=1 Tax=Tripterygium wilfordii TaxID=458696 RepID=UPI0018F812B6|nr:ALA-interacting subunit 1-like isoform X2 [Tripterygium wilfordii]